MNKNAITVLKVEYLMTRKCQLSCDYCKITDNNSLQGEEMGTEESLLMLDMISEMWPGAPVIFFGGEPTMREDLPELIARCVERDIKHAVISNSIRILKDKKYRERLIAAGLSNWSCSLDGLDGEGMIDASTAVKSSQGFDALKMMRDDYGIRDLVTCITVTKKNIGFLPEIVHALTMEGIWSICTPLQIGDDRYHYSCGNPEDLPTQRQIESISPILKDMAECGRYLMHNDPDWFDVWKDGFRSQDWRCHDKSLLTVDADGQLRFCVDIELPKSIHVLDLEEPEMREAYLKVLEEVPHCGGCLWDPAYEAIKRALDPKVGEEAGRKSYRHELSETDIKMLLPEARKWFQ